MKYTIFLINIIIWIIGIIFISIIESIYSIPMIIGFILNLILFFNSNQFIISDFDILINSDWNLFFKKLKWSNKTSIYVTLFLFFIIAIIKNYN